MRRGVAIYGDNSKGFLGGVLMASSLIHELWMYLRIRKKFWLVPIIIAMSLVGAIIAFAQGSALAPFIYSIF
jgi:fluoride ion exporter CrcB/FEX